MLLLGALLGGRLLRGRPAGTGEARSRRIFDAAPHFLAAGFLAAGFLAAGFRLAAAMADVSPVPSEGARALAVDSRAAAPHAPGPVPRASLPPHRARHGPLVRRRSAAAIGPTTQRRVAVDAPQKAAPPARASRMSVGVAAHVFSGNCGVVRRSKPLNPRADCVLGHGVATALRHGFLPRLRLCPLAPTALRLLEQVQGILDAVRAVYGGTGNARLCRLAFLRYFLLPQFRGVRTPRTRSNTP